MNGRGSTVHVKKRLAGMASKNHRGKVIFRQWDNKTGLQEIETSFSSLSELFDLCSQARAPQLVDRVVIEGEDSTGAARVLSLAFQSVTVANER